MRNQKRAMEKARQLMARLDAAAGGHARSALDPVHCKSCVSEAWPLMLIYGTAVLP